MLLHPLRPPHPPPTSHKVNTSQKVIPYTQQPGRCNQRKSLKPSLKPTAKAPEKTTTFLLGAILALNFTNFCSWFQVKPYGFFQLFLSPRSHLFADFLGEATFVKGRRDGGTRTNPWIFRLSSSPRKMTGSETGWVHGSATSREWIKPSSLAKL